MISNRQQSLVSFYQAADLFYCCRPVTAMKRTILTIFCAEGAFARRAANQEIDTLFEDAVRNTVAFALHGADLKQYISPC
ncbi:MULTISPECIES: hypothetical protein [Rhizobium]|nr:MULTISPECIES: hypothetical protein [Rhizobium]WET72778.1 hypothetical protein PYR68_15030 [Rhizobium croatiense]